MKIDVSSYKVDDGETLSLGKRSTDVAPLYTSKAHYQEILGAHQHKLSRLQEDLYRSTSYALLLVLQGMDTAGKDGAISHVMSGVDPQGCKVAAFKQPTASENEHDFLWRCARELPPRGVIGIFNR